MDRMCHVNPLMHQPLVLQVLPNWALWVLQILLVCVVIQA
jgi:hypothetical protein